MQSIERRFTGLTAIAELLLGVSLFAMVLVVFEGCRSRLVALWAAGGWGDLYYLFDLLVPGSFTISPDLAAQYADPQARSGLFNYFSLATITSVGYGDIAPIRGPMTAIAMLETVFGQFYLAVVVAQLVGIRLAQGTQDKDGG